MKRSVPVARLACMAVGSGLVTLFLVGCPGNLDPALLGGGVGGAGDQGTGGSSGGCEVPILASCAMNVCHGAALQSAGMDLRAPIPASRLVGVAATGTTGCDGMNLLDPGSSPASGLMLTNLHANPPCGSQMPLGVTTPLTPTEIDCLQQWANGLVSGSN